MNAPLERIYWKDICGLNTGKNAGWMKKEGLIEEAQRLFDAEYISVGYVVHETKDYIAIAATHDGDEDEADRQYHDASMIMKSVIVRRELLGPTLLDEKTENPMVITPANVEEVFAKARISVSGAKNFLDVDPAAAPAAPEIESVEILGIKSVEPKKPKKEPRVKGKITTRVAEYLKEGKTASEIATLLGLTYPGVLYHVQKINKANKGKPAEVEAPSFVPEPDEDQILRVWEWHDEGDDVSLIAKKVGCSLAIVNKVLAHTRPAASEDERGGLD